MPAASPRLARRATVAIGVLLAIVIVFVAVRVSTDWPSILANAVPDDRFAARYVAHPVTSYLHISLGLIYLLAAPLQLSQRFRTRHYHLHRRLGRVLLSCALLSAAFALAFGIPHAWGGATEAAATVVFGTWFAACLVLAFRAIRRDAVAQHRRWMVRAFAVGLGIATIRIWTGIFEGVEQVLSGFTSPSLPHRTMFGVAFWLAFLIHVGLGEWWLRRTPPLTG